MMTELLLETITIVLLIGVLCVAWYLNRRISSLKAISQELSPILNNLTGVLNRSGSHLESLKNLSRDTKEFLAIQVPKADSLKEDLIFLVDHGEKIARQLESAVDNNRQTAQAKPQHYNQLHPQANAPQNLHMQSYSQPVPQQKPLPQTPPLTQQYPQQNVYGQHIETYGSNGRTKTVYYDDVPDTYSPIATQSSTQSYVGQDHNPSTGQRPNIGDIKENFDPYGEYPTQPSFKPNQTMNAINILSNLKKIR